MFFKYVICILVYKNTEDIKECIYSIKKYINEHKIIIINSHYDNETMHEFQIIAEKNNCDFIDVPNKGYGYGNNRGIEMAIKKYRFEYLIISNPDVIIKKFDDSHLSKYNHNIIAPVITTLKGKSQNPYWYKKNDWIEKLIYIGMKKRKRFFLFWGYGINKAIRELALIKFKHSSMHDMQIYAAHGSFLIFSYSVLQSIGCPYDEKMFLFAEEALLAHLLEKNKIDTVLTKDIQILHREDGSISLSPINETDEERKSIIYYYEKINKDRNMLL